MPGTTSNLPSRSAGRSSTRSRYRTLGVHLWWPANLLKRRNTGRTMAQYVRETWEGKWGGRPDRRPDDSRGRPSTSYPPATCAAGFPYGKRKAYPRARQPARRASRAEAVVPDRRPDGEAVDLALTCTPFPPRLRLPEPNLCTAGCKRQAASLPALDVALQGRASWRRGTPDPLRDRKTTAVIGRSGGLSAAWQLIDVAIRRSSTSGRTAGRQIPRHDSQGADPDEVVARESSGRSGSP